MFQINSMSPGGKGGSEAGAQPNRVGFLQLCLTAHWITYNCSYTLQKAGRESCKDLGPQGKERRETVKSRIITENRKRGHRRAPRQGTIFLTLQSVNCLFFKYSTPSQSFQCGKFSWKDWVRKNKKVGLDLHPQKSKNYPCRIQKGKKKKKQPHPKLKRLAEVLFL